MYVGVRQNLFNIVSFLILFYIEASSTTRNEKRIAIFTKD